MSVGPGRIVHYILKEEDVQAINRRRVPGASTEEGWPKGAQEHRGNSFGAGEHVPMIMVKIWPHEYGANIPGVNGQVFLDGNDSYWVTSVKEGTEPGTWHWPERD